MNLELRIRKKRDAGFTLMEIIVSTTIFAIASAAMMSLFNYTLKINRRTEALRQATQGMRDFVEFLVKEVRNGQIDYSVANGTTVQPPIGYCPKPTPNAGAATDGSDTYAATENRLGIITPDGDRECFYLAYGPNAGSPIGNYVGTTVFGSNSAPGLNYNPSPILAIVKNQGNFQALNPPNFSIDALKFYVRPAKDPYTPVGSGGYITIQPMVTILIKFTVSLPTGEQVPIVYQTSVSTNKYDIPNQ